MKILYIWTGIDLHRLVSFFSYQRLVSYGYNRVGRKKNRNVPAANVNL